MNVYSISDVVYRTRYNLPLFRRAIKRENIIFYTHTQIIG